jgi:hypothetical protein
VNIVNSNSLVRLPKLAFWGLCFVFIGYFGASPAVSFNTPDIQLVSHRAIYQLSLIEAANKSDWDSVEGRMVYELLGSECEGFTQNFRQILVLSGPKQGQRILDNFSSSSEAPDGNSMRFLAKEMAGDGTVEVTSGDAKLLAGQLSAHFNSPMQAEMKLDKNLLFPVAYTKAVIREAIAQHHIYSALQFDGTDQIKPVQASFAIIGNEIFGNVGLETILRDKDYSLLKRWPISIGYSSNAQKDLAESEYTVFEELFENGVAQSLILDFKDFKLSGKLLDITFPVQTKCK